MTKPLYRNRNLLNEDTLFISEFGAVSVSLPFKQSQGAEQAFNQADAYAINTLNKLTKHLSQYTVAIVNDSYGALYAACNQQQRIKECYSYTDEASLQFNYKHNNLSSSNIKSVLELSKDCVDFVIIKIPKQLDFLELILAMLSSTTTQHGKPVTVILSGMQKYISKNYYSLIDSYLSEMEVWPGLKKAKCITAVSSSLSESNSSLPPYNMMNFVHKLDLPEYQLQLYNLPNVFSRQHLDIGSRFFLNHFPGINDGDNILDLATGSGVLSLFAAKQANNLTIYATDNSALGIASCKLAANAAKLTNIYPVQMNCLFECDIAPKSLDIILCNPPFHQGHNVSDHIAHTMLEQTKPLLKSSGRLYVVGNKHLKYDKFLKKHFECVTLKQSNDKFSIFEASF